MHPLVNIAINAARSAGDIILRNIEQLNRLKITEKAPEDYCSEVDLKAEDAIINTIHKAYPKHGILAEESGVYNEDAETVWIIDPLDGTNNYLHNFPFFAVSIAIRIKNRLEHGVIFDPIRQEIFSTSRGRGAQLNDRKIRVSKNLDLSKGIIATGLGAKRHQEQHLNAFASITKLGAATRRTGSAALDLAYVASARLDGIISFGLKPWDIAAGSLMIQEAGGLVGDPLGGEGHMRHGDIVAGNPKIFRSLLQTVNLK